MRDKCKSAIQEAAGRDLTAKELRGIEERILKAQRQLAIEDPQAYGAMTASQRLTEAGKKAAEEIKIQASKEKQRIGLKIAAFDKVDNYINERSAEGMNRLEALSRLIGVRHDFKSKTTAIDSDLEAIEKDYTRQLLGTLELTSPRILGLMQSREGAIALMYELRGKDSSEVVKNPEIVNDAKSAAKEWGDVTETMRQRYNAAGGEIGLLEDWAMPQTHDQRLVANAGPEKWFQDVLANNLDRSKYINEDGSVMNDAELQKIMIGGDDNIYLSIATGGANKIEPGVTKGVGMRARRYSASRVLHFEGPEGYIKYQQKYGSDDFYSVMMGHIKKLSRDIALIEKFGPNPDLMFDYFLNDGIKKESIADPKKAGKISKQAISIENHYNYLAGKSPPVANQMIANAFNVIRGVLTGASMGSAYLTSFPDNATMRLTAAVNSMDQVQLTRNQMSQLNPLNREQKKIMEGAGLGLDTYLNEISRWGSDMFNVRWSNKLAGLTIRASGLNAATVARQRAWGATMMNTIGILTKKYKSYDDIHESDRTVLDGYGINNDTFKIWRLAEHEDLGSGNTSGLTPGSIYRIPNEALKEFGDPQKIKQQAATKLLSVTLNEVNNAVVRSTSAQRAWIRGGLQAGTFKGELFVSMMLFKGFPFAIVERAIGRGMGMKTGVGKAAFLASHVAMSTLFGAAAVQAYEIINGRDPLDISKHPYLFLTQAFLKGGSAGVYGDFLLQRTSSRNSTPLAMMEGPVLTQAESFLNLTQGNLIDYMQGKNTNFGPEAIKFLQSVTPLQNLWYTRAATDRLIFMNLQEMLSPGYANRIQGRMENQYNKKYFWNLGASEPKRAPDFGRMTGASNAGSGAIEDMRAR